MARMLYRNIGMNRDERIQNTFTRYLTCALDREKARFRYKQRQEQKMQPYDETGDESASGELLAALADRQITQASNPHSWQDFLQLVDAGWLYKALHALTRAEADILYWRIVLDLSYAQIEAIAGLPVYEAQKRYSMAIRKLRKAAMRRRTSHDL